MKLTRCKNQQNQIIADPIEEGDKKYKKCTTNKGMRYDKLYSFKNHMTFQFFKTKTN